MRRFALTLGLTASCAFASASFADKWNASWIWLDGESASAPAAYFRREIRASEPSTGEIRIAASGPFVAWVNDQKVAAGDGGKTQKINLNGIVGRGVNVVAVEVTPKGAPAGLFVDGEVRGQGGRAIPFDSGAEWKALATKPTSDAWRQARFDDGGWAAVKVIGPHKESPWKDLAFADESSERFTPTEGLVVEQVATPKLAGSLIAMTWGPRGRLFVSRERGPIQSLVDKDGDGVFDEAIPYSREIKNCQGLCWVGNELYAVGDGPSGAAMYRLPDRDGDGKADSIGIVVKPKGGIGEHGPHDVVLGPDGWLYHNLGNHAWINEKPEPTSPIHSYEEGDLLHPRFEDALGHAVGIKAPGGCNWRFTPDGKKWWLVTMGFRNHYDIAFNAAGELFTFDSDMEWDVGEPWYKPVRVNHCIPGADFGWRSGAGNWPEYYFDAPPPTINIGRGSPTGVLVYEHDALPEKYRGALLLCDWSMGRIIVGRLTPNGASYKGAWENLVTGNPLNVSDIEVDRDGTILFTTGGRGTEGGVYRIKPAKGAVKPAAAPATVADLLKLHQPSAAWHRELAADVKKKLGDSEWQTQLADVIRSNESGSKVRALTLLSQLGPKPSPELLLTAIKDKDASVRAFATWLLGDHPSPQTAEALGRLLADTDNHVKRRALEAHTRSGTEAPVEPVLGLLASEDEWLQYAARLVLERIPAAKWADKVASLKAPWAKLNGMLALYHVKPRGWTGQRQLESIEELLRDKSTLNADQTLAAIRLTQLALIAGGRGGAADAVGKILLDRFPTGKAPLDMEAARVICFLSVPGAAEKLIPLLVASTPKDMQIHYALTLRYLDKGWTYPLKEKLLDWYETTEHWEGGDSFVPYLANIVGATLTRFTAEDRKKLIESFERRPFATRLMLKRSGPLDIADYDVVLASAVGRIEKNPRLDSGGVMIAALIDSLGKSASPAAQGELRRLFDAFPDQRDQVATVLASRPNAENWPILLRALSSNDMAMLPTLLAAIAKIDRKPDGPAPFRRVLEIGQKLQDSQKALAVNLLRRWTASDTLPFYEAWFAMKFPSEAALSAPVAAAGRKFSTEQIASFIENDPKGKSGDPAKGKAVFAKANCVKCHRFVNEGLSVGPDLSSVRRRFQRREIVESIIEPSKIISDQFKSVTIATRDGVVHTGLSLPMTSPGKLRLLLSNANQIEVPEADIEEKQAAKISVMPDGLLDELTLPEIADLFAFLETSKFNEPVTATPASGGR